MSLFDGVNGDSSPRVGSSLDIGAEKGPAGSTEGWEVKPLAYDDAGENSGNRWDVVRCYGFSIGEWNLLIEHGYYSELILQPKYSSLPNAPSHLLGVINLRGNLIPLYQIHHIICGEASGFPPQLSYALLIGKISSAAALAIQGMPKTFNMALAQPAETPSDLPDMLQHCVTNAYRFEHQLWLVLDHEKLFAHLSS